VRAWGEARRCHSIDARGRRSNHGRKIASRSLDPRARRRLASGSFASVSAIDGYRQLWVGRACGLSFVLLRPLDCSGARLYEDFDNVQVLDANQDWTVEFALPFSGRLDKRCWVVFPDRKEVRRARRRRRAGGRGGARTHDCSSS
jgi:hypothetical protein